MDKIEQSLADLGFKLPPPFAVPEPMQDMFSMVKVVGNRCVVSGHAPLNSEGGIAQPLGQLGSSLTVEQGVEAAHLTALAMLSSLKSELGSLDRITDWVKVLGMVNSAPGFDQQTPVINGFSDTISKVFGPEKSRPTRSAVGMASLPFNIPVEVEAELLVS
ncbi:MAG: RidA family protein [Sphingorhabdus sp.]